jgi:hypothetical protein
MFASRRKSNSFSRPERRSGFDPDLLPSAEDYLTTLFGYVRFNPKGWGLVRCCFHSDRRPSLSISRDGGFKCHSCGAKGRGVIDFEMLRSGTDFKTAARDLGAWR